MPGPSRTGPDARLVLIWQQCSGHDLRRQTQTDRQTDAGGKNPRAQGAPDKDGCPAVAGRTVRRQTQVGTRTLMSTMSQGLPCLMARTLQQIPAEPRKLTAPAWRISPSSRCHMPAQARWPQSGHLHWAVRAIAPHPANGVRGAFVKCQASSSVGQQSQSERASPNISHRE